MRGKGRIYRPPGKNFLMIGYYGPKADGTSGEIRESAKTLDEEKARALLDSRLRAVANARDGIRGFDGPSAARLTFGELLDALKADWEMREIKSLSQSLGRLEKVREAFGHRKAMTITADVVRKYIAKRRGEKVANATINRETEVIGAAFRLAIDEKRLVSGPKIPHLREKNARQGFFEGAEFEQVLAHLPKPLDSMARFAYATGWRRGELLALRWEWVDRTAREIRLPDSKNGEGRSLPLDEELWAVIEEAWAARRYETEAGPALSAYVFHRRGRAIFRNTFYRQWRKAAKAAKLPGKYFHDFRRTAARNMVRAGVSETVAMSITGHKTRSMFDRYNISDGKDRLEALRLSRAYIAGQAEAASKVVGINAHPRHAPGRAND